MILDAYKDDSRICKLYDYGVTEEHYWVIMKFYRCSLKEWRLRQTRFAFCFPLTARIKSEYS